MASFVFWGIFFPAFMYFILHFLNVLYFSGGVCQSKVRLDGKTALVTGANAGIGFATAKELARRGARVLLVCRNEASGRQAIEEIVRATGNVNLDVYEINLSSFHSIATAAARINLEEHRLDILVNNAGTFANDLSMTDDGFEVIFATNYLGPFYFTQLLTEKLKRSGAGSRIVTVSSSLYTSANPKSFEGDFHRLLSGEIVKNAPANDRTPFMDKVLGKLFAKAPAMVRYANANLAQILWMRRLAAELKDAGVHTYVVHPGSAFTNNMRKSAGVPDAFILYTPIVFLLKTTKQAAQTSLACAVDEDLGNESGRYYADCRSAPLHSDLAEDDGLMERLWLWSLETVANATSALEQSSY